MKDVGPGPLLDSEVATRVMQLSPGGSVPPFSTDITCALQVVEHVRRFTDGHFTLFAFTTHWKAMFGTPDFDSGHGRDRVYALVTCETAPHAICVAALTWARSPK